MKTKEEEEEIEKLFEELFALTEKQDIVNLKIIERIADSKDPRWLPCHIMDNANALILEISRHRGSLGNRAYIDEKADGIFSKLFQLRWKEPAQTSNPGNPEKEPLTGKLEAEGFADASIVDYINQINRMGFETCASCSGMRKDHHGRYYRPYLSVVLPEEVAFPDIGGDVFEVGDYQIKDRTYINILMEAGRSANWDPQLQKYLMFLPTVTFYVPETESVAMDMTMKKDPELVKVQQEIDEIMARQHGSEEFLDAIHRRDEVQKKINPKYGVREKSDTELDQAWKKLVASLSAASSLLKKMGKGSSNPGHSNPGSNPGSSDRNSMDGLFFVGALFAIVFVGVPVSWWICTSTVPPPE